MPDKLILITRADLPPAQQAVQAAHALRQFTEEHPIEDRAWFEESNHLALLSVQDEPGLLLLQDRAWELGVPCAAFHEPDLGGALTALALAPGAGSRRLARSLPMALQEATCSERPERIVIGQRTAAEGSSHRTG